MNSPATILVEFKYRRGVLAGISCEHTSPNNSGIAVFHFEALNEAVYMRCTGSGVTQNEVALRRMRSMGARA